MQCSSRTGFSKNGVSIRLLDLTSCLDYWTDLFGVSCLFPLASHSKFFCSKKCIREFLEVSVQSFILHVG